MEHLCESPKYIETADLVAVYSAIQMIYAVYM